QPDELSDRALHRCGRLRDDHPASSGVGLNDGGGTDRDAPGTAAGSGDLSLGPRWAGMSWRIYAEHAAAGKRHMSCAASTAAKAADKKGCRKGGHGENCANPIVFPAGSRT